TVGQWLQYTEIMVKSSVCLLFVFSPFPITVQPEVFISRSDPNNQYKPLTLSCLVTGFYPVDIEVSWLRNGEVMSETLSSGVRPNHDGTHQIQKEIEINAGDEDQYSCQIEHSSLAESKLYQWDSPSVTYTTAQTGPEDSDSRRSRKIPPIVMDPYIQKYPMTVSGMGFIPCCGQIEILGGVVFLTDTLRYSGFMNREFFRKTYTPVRSD
ncbi:beta-2-microglobulin-like, partial [Carcharodon carcharias]|uniref:beta-2-microglobulin-like n=1 Tax=Carcharodon carcharias TaxID=13397 RepID=UPI001B7EC68D